MKKNKNSSELNKKFTPKLHMIIARPPPLLLAARKFARGKSKY